MTTVQQTAAPRNFLAVRCNCRHEINFLWIYCPLCTHTHAHPPPATVATTAYTIRNCLKSLCNTILHNWNRLVAQWLRTCKLEWEKFWHAIKYWSASYLSELVPRNCVVHLFLKYYWPWLDTGSGWRILENFQSNRNENLYNNENRFVLE